MTEFTDVTTRLLADMNADTFSRQEITTIVRQAVAEAMRARKNHHAQIIEIDRLVTRETRNSAIRERLPGWLTRAGLRKVISLDTSTKDWFTILNADDDGDCLRVVHPAYVDVNTGTLVQSGQLKLEDHEQHGKSTGCRRLSDLLADRQAVTDGVEEG
ncbi:hypothetical protein [Actinomadura miaoliensis]|uniref:Uncharacterized protein n=1 Tax=Actinomadura miaoliensis TaxID=430685 RepID=A0ABP7W5S8_9ACTN